MMIIINNNDDDDDVRVTILSDCIHFFLKRKNLINAMLYTYPLIIY